MSDDQKQAGSVTGILTETAKSLYKRSRSLGSNMKLFHKSTKEAGSAPGELVFVGEKKVEQSEMYLFDYDESKLVEKKLKTIEEFLPMKDTPTVSWINIRGVHDPVLIEKIGEYFELHPLVLEDIMNTSQRPKIESYDDYIFIVMKIIFYDSEENLIKSEQISIVISKLCVITFQEGGLTVFNPVRERIRSGRRRIRKRGADYLTYALLDTIVDNYFTVLENVGLKIEVLEEELEEKTNQETMLHIRDLKKDTLLLRKSIWPIREVLNSLVKEETAIVDESTAVFFRDVYDHTIQVIETIESYRELISGLVDLYNS